MQRWLCSTDVTRWIQWRHSLVQLPVPSLAVLHCTSLCSKLCLPHAEYGSTSCAVNSHQLKDYRTPIATLLWFHRLSQSQQRHGTSPFLDYSSYPLTVRHLSAVINRYKQWLQNLYVRPWQTATATEIEHPWSLRYEHFFDDIFRPD